MITLLTATNTGRKVPWFYENDLKYFRELTAGCGVVLSQAAFEALPDKNLKCQLWVISNDPDFRRETKREYPRVHQSISLDILFVMSPPRSHWYVVGDDYLFEDAIKCADSMEVTIISNGGHTCILNSYEAEHDWFLRLSHPHPYHKSLRCIRYERQPRSRREDLPPVQMR